MRRCQRQIQVAKWVRTVFGAALQSDLRERGARLLEEAVEVAQSAGLSADRARGIVSYVFSRKSGDLVQEVGGVGVTLLALADAAGIDADTAETDEIARVLAKNRRHFRLRQMAKARAGIAKEPT